MFIYLGSSEEVYIKTKSSRPKTRLNCPCCPHWCTPRPSHPPNPPNKKHIQTHTKRKGKSTRNARDFLVNNIRTPMTRRGTLQALCPLSSPKPCQNGWGAIPSAFASLELSLGAKCCRATTGAEKHVGGSSHAFHLKMANWGTTVLVGTSTVFRLQGLTVPASPKDELLSADRKDQPQARPSGALCRRESTQQVEQSWRMQQPLACKEALSNMHGRFSAECVEAPELLRSLSKYAFGTIVGKTRLCCPALPSWQQRRKLDRACF